MNKNQKSDEELVSLYISGNNNCMEMLIKRHKTRIFTSISLVVKDRYIAEDIFQETFMKVIHVLQKGTYQENGKFIAWVMRIARNLSLDHYRISKNRPIIKNSENQDIFNVIKFHEPSSLEKLVSSEENSQLKKFIKMLPPEQLEILIMRHYGDLSFKEIADICNCSVNTALGRMRYAIINLRKMMQEASLLVR